MAGSGGRTICLAEADNIAIIATSMEAGAEVEIGGQRVVLTVPLSLGHKLASRHITAGETILKYNFPIGVATEDIPLGAHVHVHNMRSAYTATYIIPEG